MARKSRVIGKVQEQLAELEYKWKVAIYYYSRNVFSSAAYH